MNWKVAVMQVVTLPVEQDAKFSTKHIPTSQLCRGRVKAKKILSLAIFYKLKSQPLFYHFGSYFENEMILRINMWTLIASMRV